MSNVRTRIAPSPTGFAHIGTIYQVIFDYAFAKKHGGQFIVRIEDTDRARFIEGAEKVIFDSLEWFNLIPDEDSLKGGPFAPYRQSERLNIYKEYVEKLLKKGDAYYCFCSKERLEKMRQEQQKKGLATKYDRYCLKLSRLEIEKKLSSNALKVVRLKIPDNEKIIFKDEISGEVEFDSNLIDDQVILKSDGFPTYHLAVVVDDYLMKITHIFRGTEWLPSTPKHILLYKAFGLEEYIPVYIHLPLILNSDGKGKLSKRNQSASVSYYMEEGYLPEAIVNYLTNVVWNHPEGKEIYSMDEFISLFEIENLQSKGARFDLAKLDWMNGEYIRALSDEELTRRLQEYLVDHPRKDRISEVVPLIKERIKKLSDFIFLTNFIWNKPEYEKAIFDKLKIDNVEEILGNILKVLQSLERPWKKEEFEEMLQELAKDLKLGNKDFFQLLRVAFSGQLVTPPLFETMKIVGEEESLTRIEYVASNFQDLPNLSETLVSEG